MKLNETINSEITKLPQVLRSCTLTKLQTYQQKTDLLEIKLPENEAVFESLPKVWSCSLFISDNCIKTPLLLDGLVTTEDLFSSERRQFYSDFLQNISIGSEKKLLQIMRQFRCREMVRIAWRDLAGWSELDETLDHNKVL